MDDQLKKFINENRQAFDSEVPDGLLFRNITMQMSGTYEKKSKWQPLRWAAIVTGVLILAAGVYFFPANKKSEQIPVASDKSQPAQEDISFIADPSYAKQIYHFKELIGLKQAELHQLKTEYPDLYKQFVNDITELDSSYQSLKTNLAGNPNREMLL